MVTASRLTIATEESDQRIQLSNAVLQGSSGQAPLVLAIQSECCLCGVGRTFFDVVCFVEDDSDSIFFEFSEAVSKSS
jgi:hypothetical protein